uniref:Uncharacterized protein n=1 Tax=mine drainage metagenome TaxID=410659 RepID=E6Q4F3_9ZZZZ
MRRIRRNIIKHLKNLRRELAASGLAFALLAGCGGGGAGAGMPSHALPSVGGNGTLSLALQVPSPSLQANRRSPKYVSPDTQYIGISYLSGVNQTFTPAQIEAPQVSFGVSSPSVCALQSNGYRFCSVAVSLAPGTYTVGITTWAAPPTSGTFAASSELSQTTLPSEVVTSGISANLGSAASINASLDAIPAGLAVAPLPSQTHVISSGTTYDIIGMSPVDFLAEPIDAAGNIIIGQGAPSVSLAPDSAHDTAVTPNTGNANEFSVQVVAWNSSPLSLTATATPPSGSGLAPQSAALSVQPVQELWDSNAGGNAGGLYGFALLPANSSFAPPSTGSGTTLSAIPADALPASSFGEIFADSLGNIWLFDSYAGYFEEYPPAGAAQAPTVSTPLIELNPSGIFASDSQAGAADAAGNVWVDDQATNNLYEFTPAQHGNSPVSLIGLQSLFPGFSTITLAAIAPPSVSTFANDPVIIAGSIGSPSTVSFLTPPYSSPTTTAISGLPSTDIDHVAFDQLGRLWVAYTSNSTLGLYSISSTGAATAIASPLQTSASCPIVGNTGNNGFYQIMISYNNTLWVTPGFGNNPICEYALNGSALSFTGNTLQLYTTGGYPSYMGTAITP